MQYLIRFAFSLLLLNLLVGSSFAVTREEIKSTIEARYKITTPGFFGNFKEIGSVLVVQKEGLRANRPGALFKPNVVMNGRITAVGGGDLPLGGNIDGNLKIGDRLHLYGIRTGDDYVELVLFTVKTFVVTGSGTRGPTPLQASARFRYDQGLAAVTSEQVIEDIGAWFKAEGEAKAEREAKKEGEAKAERDVKASRIVRLGQTPEEVTTILGEPEKKILLGAKTVFVYKDVKVVFIDGKVADAN